MWNLSGVAISATGPPLRVLDMGGRYEYTPYVWPMLGSAIFLFALGSYGWHRRSMPGALPFAFLTFFATLWAIGAALELLAADLPGKIFWFNFQAIWAMPAATASLWFALDYANLSRWLTRWAFACLWIAPVLVLLFVVTNHHWLLAGFRLQGDIRPVFGPAARALVGYGFVVALASSGVFLWLFVRSPVHRWPAGLCLAGHAATRVAFALDTSGNNPAGPMDLTVIAWVFTAGMYALALFRFHMFDLIPIARGTVIEQMIDGMLVLDAQERVVDLNPAAAKIVGASAARTRGGHARPALPLPSELSASLAGTGPAQSEITVGTGDSARHYSLHRSPLEHRRRFHIGHVILLHDITEERRAQAHILEQQRALATLHERERIARELHDSLGQVLGYVKMQAQAARGLLARGGTSEADRCLAQLAAVAQDAHADVREYILGARTGMSIDIGFVPALEQYLQWFTESCGIATRLDIPAELKEHVFEPMAATQLLRIVQETLTNVRKHASAQTVEVRLAVADGHAEMIVQDDGMGFNPALPQAADGQTSGLRFMRERAEEVGGSVDVCSAPGEGTRVIISVPLQGRRL